MRALTVVKLVITCALLWAVANWLNGLIDRVVDPNGPVISDACAERLEAAYSGEVR